MTGPGAASRLALAHGLFNALSGLWPLVHMSSFEAVSGPKQDRWLVRTVAGLLLANGLVQMAARRSADGTSMARLIGLGTAGTLAAIDLVYAPKGRISRVYLLDAVIEAGWIGGWLFTGRRAR